MSEQSQNTIADRFEAYLLGQLDDAAMEQLEEELRQAPQQAEECLAVMKTLAMVREQFRDQREQAGELTKDPTLHGFHDLLSNLSAMEAAAEAEPVHWVGQVEIARPIWQQWQFVIPSGIAALLAIAIVLIVALPRNTTTTTSPQIANGNDLREPGRVGPEAHLALTKQVATLTAEHDAMWQLKSGESLSRGDALAAGQRLTLTQGYAEITTRRGAVAILEAPASVELLGNNSLRLEAGKLVGICETPSSKGFVVRTPQMDMVDLGTEFGVTVRRDRVETVVFDGEVEVYPIKPQGTSANAVPVRLSRGKYAAAGPAGTLASGDMTDGSVGLSYLRSLNPDEVASRRYAQAVLESKPLIYWGMQDWSAGSVVNSGIAGARHGGVAEAAERQDGGIGGSFVQFDRDADSIITMDQPIPELEGSDSYTIECWVRVQAHHRGMIARLSKPGRHSIMHLEVIDEVLKDADIGETGRTVRWVHRDNPTQKMSGRQLYSDPYPLGSWMHLVCVKNGDRLELFVDGKSVARGTSDRPLAAPSRLSLGMLSARPIGESSKDDDRNFYGGLDEFALYRQPLDAQVIKRHYALGSDALLDHDHDPVPLSD
ncbi:MAG: LamG-like jellyroll fold domain-containing protein [Planctomycetota bacterium]